MIVQQMGKDRILPSQSFLNLTGRKMRIIHALEKITLHLLKEVRKELILFKADLDRNSIDETAGKCHAVGNTGLPS